jgi:agmatine/peptidylarginine deiminase
MNSFRSDPEFTQWPWVCDPEYAHDTGPTPESYRYLGEFDLTSGVLFSMGEWTFGCFLSDQRELIRASLETGAEVTILADQNRIPNVKRCLRGNGFSNAQIDRINFAPVKVDSVWIRDFGPEFLSDRSDPTRRAMVDPTYFGVLPRPDNCRPVERGPNTWGRDRDDASPTRLNELVRRGTVELRGVEDSEVYRPRLVFDGGNIFTDGEGTCFRNQQLAEKENSEAWFFTAPWIVGGWDHTPEQVDRYIEDYYNCDEVVVLDSMTPTTHELPWGGVLDHIDLIVTFLSSDTVIVGDYNYRTDDGEYLTLDGSGEPDDPVNAKILDDNARRLEDAGYHVVRIPMPVPHCTVGGNCRHDYDRDLSSNTLIPCPDHTIGQDGAFVGGFDLETGWPIFRNWATFTNSIRIGDSLMVPSYPGTAAGLGDANGGPLGEELRRVLEQQEEEALRVYRNELERLYDEGVHEERVEVVPVPSDGLAPCNGSLRCITKTY